MEDGSAKMTLSKFVSEPKHPSPRIVTEVGITTLVKELHELNALLSILFKEFGKLVTLVNAGFDVNALSPMVFNKELLEKLMDRKMLHR